MYDISTIIVYYMIFEHSYHKYNHSHIDFAKIQKYSKCEQDMMFKYKWNKNANEKHPYKIS